MLARPALLVTAVASAAVVVIFIGQVAGRPFAHHASIVLPALALVGFEALCVLVGYLTLGRLLGLRRARTDLASEEQARA